VVLRREVTALDRSKLEEAARACSEMQVTSLRTIDELCRQIGVQPLTEACGAAATIVTNPDTVWTIPMLGALGEHVLRDHWEYGPVIQEAAKDPAVMAASDQAMAACKIAGINVVTD
jgi:hypothetical protein